MKKALHEALTWASKLGGDAGDDAVYFIREIVKAAAVADADPKTLLGALAPYAAHGEHAALDEISAWTDVWGGRDNRDAAILFLLQRDALSVNELRARLQRHGLSGGKRDVSARVTRLARDKLIKRVIGGRGSGHRWAAV